MDSKERARMRAAARNASSWYRPKGSGPGEPPADNRFRILPTPESKTTPANFYEYFKHRNVGPKKLQLRCGKDPVTEEGKCWLCDVYLPKLRAKGMDKRAKELSSKITMLLQVASVDDDGTMHGPLLWEPPKTVADNILASFLGTKGKRTYEDATNGYNLTITRTGTGLDTRYGMITADDDPTPVPSKIMAAVKPFSLLTEIQPYSESKQKAAIQGIDDVVDEEDLEDEDLEETDEEDEEEAEVVATKKTAAQVAPAKKKPAPAVEDEEDEDKDDEELEPPKKPASAPAKKAGTPAKKGPVIEEDEDEDLDLDDEELEETDEEDEPPPPPKKKPVKK